MEMKTIKISEKGQVAIPREIRKQMGLKRGDELVIIQDEDRILMEKADRVSKKVRDDFKDILKFSEESLKEIWDNKEDDIWESYLEK